MQENARDALIALRDIKDPDEYVEKITAALKGDAEIELAYMLGRIDQASINYFSTSSLSSAVRTVITQSFGFAKTPKSAHDYKSAEELAEELAADA